ncbi:MAG: transposase [Bryobacterales bacterium]|nr:transposase [Bryobacterales bacterium]
MATTRKQYSPKFKAKVAVEAIHGDRTLNQLASQYHVHPVQISQWRKTALEQLADLFTDGRKGKRSGEEVEKDALYEEIGRLKVELDWLKKGWSARLKWDGCWWNRIIRRSVCGASASCWASTGRACTTSRWARARRTSC